MQKIISTILTINNVMDQRLILGLGNSNSHQKVLVVTLRSSKRCLWKTSLAGYRKDWNSDKLFDYPNEV